MKGMKGFMEQINFDSNKQIIKKTINSSNQDVSTQNLQTQNANVKFEQFLSEESNNQSDLKSRNIIKDLSQKYHVNITITPNETEKSVIQEGNFSPVDKYGCNTAVIIPRNLLNKMATDPKVMKDVEYAIKGNVDGFKRTESIRKLIGDKITYSSPLTFSEDGNWSASCSSVSENFSSASKKIGITQSGQEESSNNTTKNNSITSQVISSGNSAETSSSHLNTGTIRFVIENGMARYAYVDGIKMEIADMLLTNKSQLKERIIKKYNKTDAEKLEEIFDL